MLTWKRSLLALGAMLVAGLLAAVALGQEGGPIQMTATVKVTPDEAGTPSRPRGVGRYPWDQLFARPPLALPPQDDVHLRPSPRHRRLGALPELIARSLTGS
jgi:hypothetical protein